MSGLTGVRDLDLKILQNLDDRELPIVCTTNKYVRDLCNDENFWLNRLVARMGYSLSEIKKLKGSFKYKDIYRYIYLNEEQKGIMKAAERDHIYLFKYLENFLWDYRNEAAKIASKNGSIDIITYLFINTDNEDIEELKKIISRAANLETAVWLDKMNQFNYREYIKNLIHTENSISRIDEYINETDAEYDEKFFYELGLSIKDFDLSSRINLLDYFIKKLDIRDREEIENVTIGAKESGAQPEKIKQWISHINSLKF